MTGITIHYSVGVVAAALTVVEFILSTATGAATLSIFRGLWLSQLHRTQKASVTASARPRRIKRRDLFGAILGTWFVIVIALLESNLLSVVWVSNETIESDNCLSMNRSLELGLITDIKPTLHAGVNSWVLSVTNQIQCEAIASVEAGSATDNETSITALNAPICTTPIEHGPEKEINIQVKIRDLLISRNRLAARPGQTAYVEMWPVDSVMIPPPRRIRLGPKFKETKGICNENGISSFLFALTHTAGWIGIFSSEIRTAHAVHELVCKSHMDTYGNETEDRIHIIDEEIGLEEALSCRQNYADTLDRFNPSCLESLAQSKTYSANITAVWALTYGDGDNEPSYACVNVTVEVRYLFVSPTFMTAFDSSATVEYPVIIPFSFSILDGHCEVTAHVLARSALVYAADANYRKTTIAEVGLLRLYHLYMIATASVQIPITTILRNNDKGLCSLRKVYEVTVVERDWRLVFLIVTMVVALLIWIAGGALRYRYNNMPWGLGSAHWAFEQLESAFSQGNEGKGIEIVGKRRTDNFGNGQGPRRSSLRERVVPLPYEIQAVVRTTRDASASAFD